MKKKQDKQTNNEDKQTIENPIEKKEEKQIIDMNIIRPIREYKKNYEFKENMLADTGKPAKITDNEELKKQINEYFNT